jgi:CrcB protein
MKPLIRAIADIGFGGFLGANARFLLNRGVARWLGPSYPYGTLIVNFTRSLLLGFFLIWTTERVITDYQRIFVAIGFCGAYATFSSYGFEAFTLLDQGHYWLAATNILGNNLLELSATLAGAMLAQSL